MLDPVVYAKELTKKMKAYGAEAWLVNTGWTGGPYNTGIRIDLSVTRRIINAILDNSIKAYQFSNLPVFNLSVPSEIDGIDTNLLDPQKAWNSPLKWRIAATDLALKFISNFNKFTASDEAMKLMEYGPRVL